MSRWRSSDHTTSLQWNLADQKWCLLLVAILLIGCKGPVRPEPRPPRQNRVILVSIDTLRADHLSCYGHIRATSPFIDNLAAGGVVFDHAIVQMPATLPSHMSMLTGLLPVEHDVFPPDSVLSPEIPLLQEVLAGHGVRTAGFTEGGYASGRFGFSRGFDRFDDAARKSNTDVEDTFGRAIEFLETIGGEESFFLFVHTYAVHDPYFPPPPYSPMYLPGTESSDISGFPRFSAGDFPASPGEETSERIEKHNLGSGFVERHLPAGSPLPIGRLLSKVNRKELDFPPEAIPFYESLYDASINYVDDVVAAFFARLDELGLADSTTVILTSDHGEEFLEHGRVVHEQVYHECLHVPLIVIGPEVVAGRRVQDLVMSIDIMPTILGIYGLEAPRPVSGHSLQDYLHPSGTTATPRDAYASAFVDPSETIYRMIDFQPHQLVAHEVSEGTLSPWAQEEIAVKASGKVLNFEAVSFHEPRQVEILSGSEVVASLTLAPTWSRFAVELPHGSSETELVFRAQACVSPASVSDSDDTRCLSFRLRGLEIGRTELFNIAVDPLGTLDLSRRLADLTGELKEGLEAFHRQAIAESENAPLDEATEERLRALGYLQ